MNTDAQILPPKMLGFWTRTLRMASNLSQDALAEVSGLTVRTVQRIESGERASLTTRRCLARGLGYDNLNIFDEPAFVSTVTDLFDSIRAEQIKTEETRYPDYIKVEVLLAESGAALGSLIDRSDAWVFHCDEKASSKGQTEAATLFDHLQDYGDIWPEVPPSGRLEAQATFTALLANLTQHGLCAYHGIRRTGLIGPDWKSRAPLPWSIAYVVVVPLGRHLSDILVPKAG